VNRTLAAVFLVAISAVCLVTISDSLAVLSVWLPFPCSCSYANDNSEHKITSTGCWRLYCEGFCLFSNASLDSMHAAIEISHGRVVVNVSRDSSVGIALGYGLDDWGSRVHSGGGGLGIFLFTTASRTALGPTQPPIQWVPGALSLRVKRPGREADHSPI
jgi:hypothetical protein